MTTETALVVAGAPHTVDLAPHVAAASIVIAADGGLDHLAALDVWPDLVVGDLDSVSPGALASAAARGVSIDRHASAKDETDLELALMAAVSRGAGSIVVAGLEGGRPDHELAGLLILGSARWAGCAVTALLRGGVLAVVRGQRRFTGRPGDLVTLLAIGGPADGVTTEGLRYPLRGERLEPGSGRGLSNEFVTGEASVAVEAGVLYAVRPDPT